MLKQSAYPCTLKQSAVQDTLVPEIEVVKMAAPLPFACSNFISKIRMDMKSLRWHERMPKGFPCGPGRASSSLGAQTLDSDLDSLELVKRLLISRQAGHLLGAPTDAKYPHFDSLSIWRVSIPTCP